MLPAEVIGASSLQRVLLDGQEVACRLVRSKSARKLRIKVRLDEIEIVVPTTRESRDGLAFVAEHRAWVLDQLERARRLRMVRRPDKPVQGQLLFRGERLPVKVTQIDAWLAPSRVVLEDGAIRVTCGRDVRTPLSRSLENWLRRQARDSVNKHMEEIGRRVRRTPSRVYVMGQRTKWGNCSALGNLSFNWRLVMAPDYVLRYVVTHEMVHLAIPDHSRRFWLMVQSLCPDADRARQWLVANGHRLTGDLSEVFTVSSWECTNTSAIQNVRDATPVVHPDAASQRKAKRP